MTKKPMQVANPLFPGVVCATCLKEHPNLRVIPDLPGQPHVCPTCYDRIVPQPTKMRAEVVQDPNYTALALFQETTEEK